MKKILSILIILSLIACIMCGCSEREYFLIEDGVDYKNPTLSLEYISYDTVRVTFAVDLYTFRGEITADIVLVSEDTVVGTCTITLKYSEEEPRVSAVQDVKLTYYNAGAITGYVNRLDATYFE